LLWSKNKKTALQVAEARGAVLLEAARHNITVSEFNPNQIKMAVTGYGKSDKKQIMCMVEKLVKINTRKKHDDEYDAIAVALTCSAMNRALSTEIIV
jgi:crossover junction endodeoxyribonuclease RuvC